MEPARNDFGEPPVGNRSGDRPDQFPRDTRALRHPRQVAISKAQVGLDVFQ